MLELETLSVKRRQQEKKLQKLYNGLTEDQANAVLSFLSSRLHKYGFIELAALSDKDAVKAINFNAMADNFNANKHSCRYDVDFKFNELLDYLDLKDLSNDIGARWTSEDEKHTFLEVLRTKQVVWVYSVISLIKDCP